MAKLGLSPEAEEGKYFFGTFPESSFMALAGYLRYFAAIVREDEGIGAVFSGEAKEGLKLYSREKFEGPFCLIVFRKTTGLGEVGITAAASSALAKERIAANFVSGYFHDCVLVPYEKKETALACLKRL